MHSAEVIRTVTIVAGVFQWLRLWTLNWVSDSLSFSTVQSRKGDGGLDVTYKEQPLHNSDGQ